ncbi:hypothetical protein AVEN_72059-1 [Araneus ventricosus]|uniref:Uncharacterized protein n=1 Tax=Araneus ventricosus TaxID=182803 RepID=A0A4Y2PSW0_ARAVE|nr:hypothetical protein AVEN_72059-1 [Araneus ventricosus]
MPISHGLEINYWATFIGHPVYDSIVDASGPPLTPGNHDFRTQTATGSMFDPIGFLAPTLIQPKILLPATWKTKEFWDAEVNDEIKKKILKWFKELNYLKNIKIPRWLGVAEMCHISLHTFVEASQIAYSACVFLRSETHNDKVNVQLLQVKSRITLLKKITIPRLELMAATIGARLFDSVKRTLKSDDFERYFWTDSSTVLTWIKRQDP